MDSAPFDKNAVLVAYGPYRWMRRPLYLTGRMGYLGCALLAENGFIALLAVVTFALLSIRLAREEAFLIQRFGDDYRGVSFR